MIATQETWRHDPPRALLRRAALVLMAGAIASGAVFGARSNEAVDYPFLLAAPGRAPDVVYWPGYWPSLATLGGASLTVSNEGVSPARLESRSTLASYNELVIWESTASDATPHDAMGTYGAYTDEGHVRGSLALWTVARANDLTVLYARIGSTLVVIAAALPVEELLRIGDSLRPTRPSSLIL